MAFIIVVALVSTRRLSLVPKGFQNFVETGVDFLNKFAKEQFGEKYAPFLSVYLGNIVLFLLFANIIGFLTPVEFTFMGKDYVPPFDLKPPARDINVSGLLAVITILMTIVYGFRARGVGGMGRKIIYPVAFMLPFNLMEYGTRLLSLGFRLFGNILGSMILMILIMNLIPLVVPEAFSLYFDFFDGLMQAGIFSFLSVVYISEAIDPATTAAKA
jgi:F-type H+-transporting ATPase subunit a